MVRAKILNLPNSVLKDIGRVVEGVSYFLGCLRNRQGPCERGIEMHVPKSWGESVSLEE